MDLTFWAAIILAFAAGGVLGLWVPRRAEPKLAILRVTEGKRGRWRWWLIDAQNKVICRSRFDGWKTREEAESHGVDTVGTIYDVFDVEIKSQ